jgi:D-glycero-alpha-D-manno-heptose-7-phosphate kinase
MITTKTPLRMSYVGGGSDFSSYYKENDGAVLSTAIDKYVYVSINKKFDNTIRLSYSETENVKNASEVKHPIVREALNFLEVDRGVEIVSMADIPSQGTGLGSSSSFTVGLLNAIYAYKGEVVSKEVLASQACNVEINLCKAPIGKQDQYAAAYGGMNLIVFKGDETVEVQPVVSSEEILKQIETWTLVFYTGKTRNAGSILATQTELLKRNDKQVLVRRMVQLAFELKKEIESGSLENFGEILHENWKLKSQICDGISDKLIDECYEVGINAGALGGKLLGAGNGGFIMFFAHPSKHESIYKALKNLSPIKFGFDMDGANVCFRN